MHLLAQAKKLEDDVRHGGKLGPRSTLQLVTIVCLMAEEIERLRRAADDAGVMQDYRAGEPGRR